MLYAGGQSGVRPDIVEGIYFNEESFLLHRPDKRLQEIHFEWYVSPEDNYARGIFHLPTDSNDIVPKVVCIQGDCYLFDPERKDNTIRYFARMVEMGSICIFKRFQSYAEWIPMKAYNPVNGRAFMQGRIPRNREFFQWYMWRPEDNQVKQMDRQSYADWTGFDIESVLREQDMIQGIRSFNQIQALEKRSLKDN